MPLLKMEANMVDRREAILALDKQLKAIEDEVQKMRRQLLSEMSPKKLMEIADAGVAVVDLSRDFVENLCMVAFEKPNRYGCYFWSLCVHLRHDILNAPTREFVRAAMEHRNAPVRDMKSLPSEIFEGNYEFWMKEVPDSPILLLYLPTEGRYSDFDEEVIWRHPNVRTSPYYWRRKFKSHPRGEKPDDLLNDFAEVAKQNLSLRTDMDVLVAAIEAGKHWRIHHDFFPSIDPSVILPADFWAKALKETGGSALKHMPFELQVQHAELLQESVQYFDKTTMQNPPVAPELWSNQSFCVEWLRLTKGCLGDNEYSLIPSGVWSDRSFCLELVQMRHWDGKNPLIPPRTLRPLIAPTLWSDQSFCMEWVQLMNDATDELSQLIPAKVWSKESFCVFRAKHIHGEVNDLFERFPAYRTSREFWLSLLSGPKLCGSAKIFRKVSRETPALSEDAELMLVALRWSKDDRSTFIRAVAPSLYDQPAFFRKALKVTGCKVLKVISRDRQIHFREMILTYFSTHRKIANCVWSYLAPDLHENRSICVEWIRGGADRRKFKSIPQSVIDSREFWLELAPYGKERHVRKYFEKSCPFFVEEDFLLQIAGIYPHLLRCSNLWVRIRKNKQLAILAMQQTNRLSKGIFWRLSDHLREDFDVQVCALAHKVCLSDEGEREVERMYPGCKLEIRDKLRTHECYMLCLELEPIMNVPGLQEEFAGYLGVSSGKELSQLTAAWKQYH